MQEEAEIIIYALGGGMGHMVRASSLARAIHEQSGLKPLLLVTPGFTRLVPQEGFQFRVLTPTEDPSGYRTVILKSLDKLRPRTLVVDALPMGLMGEMRDYLPDFKGKKVFIARYLREDYRRLMEIDEFVRRHYDLVIRSEPLPEKFLEHPNSISTSPILAMDASGLSSRKEARRMMNVADGRFLVIAVGSDTADRTDEFFETVHATLEKIGDPRIELRFSSPYGKPSPKSMHTRYFPLMEILPAADLVVGHAGYHLFHECSAAGAPALLFPRPRLYDDQEARVKSRAAHVATFRNAAELEEGLYSFLSGSSVKRPRRKKTASGAQKAARAIIKLI